MSKEIKRFVEGIAAQPNESGNYAVLMDWLEEHGEQGQPWLLHSLARLRFLRAAEREIDGGIFQLKPYGMRAHDRQRVLNTLGGLTVAGEQAFAMLFLHLARRIMWSGPMMARGQSYQLDMTDVLARCHVGLVAARMYWCGLLSRSAQLRMAHAIYKGRRLEPDDGNLSAEALRHRAAELDIEAATKKACYAVRLTRAGAVMRVAVEVCNRAGFDRSQPELLTKLGGILMRHWDEFALDKVAVREFGRTATKLLP